MSGHERKSTPQSLRRVPVSGFFHCYITVNNVSSKQVYFIHFSYVMLWEKHSRNLRFSLSEMIQFRHYTTNHHMRKPVFFRVSLHAWWMARKKILSWWCHCVLIMFFWEVGYCFLFLKITLKFSVNIWFFKRRLPKPWILTYSGRVQHISSIYGFRVTYNPFKGEMCRKFFRKNCCTLHKYRLRILSKRHSFLAPP